MISSDAEKDLIRQISLFPEVIENATNNRQPNLVANYAYTLASKFNAFYERCPVIRADNKLKKARLELVKAFKQTISNALWLLGIETVDVM